jgi:flagellar FliJ protein
MKPRSTRLAPAADHAREKREAAAQRLAEQQNRLQAAEHQLSELRRYRAEYALDGAAAVAVTALLNRQHFVERIDRAIAQQLLEVERQRRLLDQAGASWRAAHARERALESVIGQAREQERKSEERREQNDIDERMQHRQPRHRS